MSKKDKTKAQSAEHESPQSAESIENSQQPDTPDVDSSASETEQTEQLKTKYDEINDKYIRLVAEFDNYKRRTLRERIELIRTAGEDILKDLLPIADDFDRALQSINQSSDIEGLKKGLDLIYVKFMDFLKQKGIVEIEASNADFDIDKHEAVAKIPVSDNTQKGKIVDVVKKGYTLNDKVVRYAQVVIGE